MNADGRVPTTYPKIETLFDRGANGGVISSSFRRPEYELIGRWVVTEKIDGVNVRLVFVRDVQDGVIRGMVRGRSDAAEMHPGLVAHCGVVAERCLDVVRDIMHDHDLNTFVVYGEGFGAGIRNGGKYQPEPTFTMFDVASDGRWLDVHQTFNAAQLLSIPHVPILSYRMPMDEIVNFVRRGFKSAVSRYDAVDAEGVVARTAVPLYDRRGERVILKLKTKDFK